MPKNPANINRHNIGNRAKASVTVRKPPAPTLPMLSFLQSTDLEQLGWKCKCFRTNGEYMGVDKCLYGRDCKSAPRVSG